MPPTANRLRGRRATDSAMEREKAMTTKSRPTTASGANKRPRKKKLTPEERYLKIQAATYYLAEKDAFSKDAVEYWLAAEAKVGA